MAPIYSMKDDQKSNKVKAKAIDGLFRSKQEVFEHEEP